MKSWGVWIGVGLREMKQCDLHPFCTGGPTALGSRYTGMVTGKATGTDKPGKFNYKESRGYNINIREGVFMI